MQRQKTKKLPYRKRKYFFTDAERTFFNVLQRVAAKNKYVVFSKVRLEDLFLPLFQNNKGFLYYRGKVRSRHVDFVICDAQLYNTILIIELDDSTHKRPDRMERDKFIDLALEDAGLPILHIPNASYYGPKTLQSQIQEKPIMHDAPLPSAQ